MADSIQTKFGSNVFIHIHPKNYYIIYGCYRNNTIITKYYNMDLHQVRDAKIFIHNFDDDGKYDDNNIDIIMSTIVFCNLNELHISIPNNIVWKESTYKFISNHTYIKKLIIDMNHKHIDQNLIDIINMMDLDILIIHRGKIGDEIYCISKFIQKIIICKCDLLIDIGDYLALCYIPECTSTSVSQLIHYFSFENNVIIDDEYIKN